MEVPRLLLVQRGHVEEGPVEMAEALDLLGRALLHMLALGALRKVPEHVEEAACEEECDGPADAGRREGDMHRALVHAPRRVGEVVVGEVEAENDRH